MTAIIFYIIKKPNFLIQFLLSEIFIKLSLIKTEDLRMIKNYIYKIYSYLNRITQNIMTAIIALAVNLLPSMFNMLKSSRNSNEKGENILYFGFEL